MPTVILGDCETKRAVLSKLNDDKSKIEWRTVVLIFFTRLYINPWINNGPPVKINRRGLI